MPDVTCSRCRKTIPLKEAGARVHVRCPFCKKWLTLPAAPQPAAIGITLGRHASIQTPPPPDLLAGPRFDASLPPSVRRRRGPGEAGIAAVVLLLLGLLGAFLGALPHFWQPTVRPPPPRVLALPAVASPALEVRVAALEPAVPIPDVVAAVGDKPPPVAAEPPEADPRRALFRAKLKSLEWLFGPPRKLEYSADSRRASFVSRQDVVRLWDVDEPKELLFLTAGAAYVAFSPDGSQALAADGNGTLHLWDLAVGVDLRRMGGGRGKVVAVAFSPDGAEALVGHEAADGGTALRMWDLKTGREVTDPVAWRAEWVLEAAAMVPLPNLPPFAEEEGEATTTAHTLLVPSRPVEAEGVGPVEAPVYLLSTTIGKRTTTEIVEVDGGR